MSDKNNQNIYNEIFSRLGNIEGKLDRALRTVDKTTDDHDKRLNSHDIKLDTIEEKISLMKGRQKGSAAAWGFFGGAVSVIIAIITCFRE